MTLADLNRKISLTIHNAREREDAAVVRDTRLGILGVHAGMEPTPAQVAIVDAEIFPPEPQQELVLPSPAKPVSVRVR